MRSSRSGFQGTGCYGARVLAVVALAWLGGCKSETKPPEPGPGGEEVQATRTALLGAVGACVTSSARDFQQAAAELQTATAALVAQPESSTRDAARAAYHRAMDTWQILEVMQLGPAAPRTMPGGEELRDNIYSWPLVSRCAVEEQLVSRGYEAQDFPNTLISRRGLYALEYLLFYEGTDTACGPTSPIVSGGTWAALSSDERQARKRAYAAAAAADVRRRADQLLEAWEPGKGDFSKTLETAGAGNTLFATSQAGLNSVSDALFYVDKILKDAKLARPLALRDCDSDICPEWLESRFAARSKANVRSNLVGFRRLAEGCGADYSGLGFDDLLVAVGSEPVAVKLRQQAAASLAAVDAVEESDLELALTQDKASVRAVYDASKAITDVLKTEFVTVLDLELPQTVEGDND